MNGFKKIFIMLGFFSVLGLGVVTQQAYAQLAEEAVVTDFADFMVRIIDSPISKILAVVILITAVVYLFRGDYAKAVAAGFAFAILIFLPQIIATF